GANLACPRATPQRFFAVLWVVVSLDAPSRCSSLVYGKETCFRDNRSTKEQRERGTGQLKRPTAAQIRRSSSLDGGRARGKSARTQNQPGTCFLRLETLTGRVRPLFEEHMRPRVFRRVPRPSATDFATHQIVWPNQDLMCSAGGAQHRTRGRV